MAGRRNGEKWTKIFQATTIVIFLVFVLVTGYGLKQMFDEIREITIIQQELILNLTQNGIQKIKSEVETEKIDDQFVNKVVFIKYKNETDRKIKELEKMLDRLKKRMKLKSPF